MLKNDFNLILEFPLTINIFKYDYESTILQTKLYLFKILHRKAPKISNYLRKIYLIVLRLAYELKLLLKTYTQIKLVCTRPYMFNNIKHHHHTSNIHYCNFILNGYHQIDVTLIPINTISRAITVCMRVFIWTSNESHWPLLTEKTSGLHPSDDFQ